MHKIFEKIKTHSIVPVIKIDRPDNALPLCEALIEGGLPVAEITFRTDAAEESIRLVLSRYSDSEILLGAGTVINVELVKRAVDAGASYIISPGMSGAVVEYCLKTGIPVCPGVVTPTEIQQALDYGLEVLKFFPAEQAGGTAMLKALSGPFPDLRFIPTGGINAGNLLKYLELKMVIACGGSWMVKDELIAQGNFSAIHELVREAVSLIK